MTPGEYLKCIKENNELVVFIITCFYIYFSRVPGYLCFFKMRNNNLSFITLDVLTTVSEREREQII